VPLPREFDYLPPAGAAPDARALAATVAALQPEGAIVVDEAISSRAEYYELAAASPPHTLLGLPGGAIGQGLPLATGAALAAPGRRVIAVVGDGSALYTIQALWTQARERLDVTTIICSNRSYAVLRRELARGGFPDPGPRAASLLDLDPALDWPALAGSFGVPATRAETTGELAVALRRSLGTDGPHLIEAVMP
jgi:acetolactate synthase-1/2/3 large subunit